MPTAIKNVMFRGKFPDYPCVFPDRNFDMAITKWSTGIDLIVSGTQQERISSGFIPVARTDVVQFKGGAKDQEWELTAHLMLSDEPSGMPHWRPMPDPTGDNELVFCLQAHEYPKKGKT